MLIVGDEFYLHIFEYWGVLRGALQDDLTFKNFLKQQNFKEW